MEATERVLELKAAVNELAAWMMTRALGEPDDPYLESLVDGALERLAVLAPTPAEYRRLRRGPLRPRRAS